MQRLSARDLRAVVQVAHELGEIEEAEEFRTRLLAQLRRLVPYDLASWNLVSRVRRQAQIGAVHPLDGRAENDEEIFAAHAHQNPLVIAAAPGRVSKFSDYVTLRQLHDLDLYDAVYRHRAIERQIAFTLPAPLGSIIGVALSRTAPDFTERDRAVLKLAAPLVARNYQRVAALEVMYGTLAALEKVVDATPQAVIVVNRRGVIEYATRTAWELLRGLPAPERRAGLPEPLASWATQPGLAPLAGGAWTARLLPANGSGFTAIVLEPTGSIHAVAMRAAGLTEREIQVLALVAAGLSNIQTARQLIVSERTVAKHLEHIFVKLGVTNRTAAVAAARAAATAR